MTSIILCATQRCGSTMIIEDMRNTGVLGNPEEWFIPWNPHKPDADWQAAFGSVRRKATGENGVLAVKVMANQVFNIDKCLSTFLTPEGNGDFPSFAAAFPDAKWVKLTRKDIVGQAISRLMATQTGINHATANPTDRHFAGNLMKGYDPEYNAGSTYDREAIHRIITSIVLENLMWDRFFASNGIEPVEFVYEEVARDSDARHVDILANLAGLTARPARKPRTMVKMANEKNLEWRKTFYDDLAATSFRLSRS